MPTTELNPAELLSRFGLKSFRPGQDEVVGSVLAGQDVLCVMPTGGGKSLCYQLPSLAMRGTTIVVSPLIALMKDQVDALHARGISAALINSTLTAAEQGSAMEKMARGEFDLVYVAPERLRNSRFLEAVAKANVSLLAVDEAHCISEWGHDFRPDYARLGLFRERYLGGVQTIALTATATPLVREDISKLLRLKTPRQFVTGFARTNLRFSVEHCKGDRDKDEWLTEYLNSQPGAGIIYAATRKRCEELAGWLPEKLRRPIGVYHAGLEPAQRQTVQNDFMSGKVSAIVATNAFGMGIDKSDLRFVVHYNMPGTLEAYYQEAGRAGRDGLDSECALLFSYSDRHIQEFFIESRYPTAELVKKVYQFLLRRTEDPIEMTLNEVRDAVERDSSAEAISTAETLLGRAGVLKRLDSSSNHAVIRIESDLPTLVDLLPREAKLRRKVMRAVEKVVGKHRHEDVYVRPQRLCELADVSREQLTRVLRELNGLQAFDYVPPFRGRAVHLIRRDLKFEELNIDFEELERRKAGEYEKLEAVINFARTAKCRQGEILGYFGDTSGKACGSCDRCQPVNPRLLAAGGGKTGATVERSSPTDDPNLCRGLQIVLSGIARTHGRFGKGLVAQMLCGSSNKKIQQWKLNRLSTYGLLSGMKQTQVSDVIDALTEIGLVSQQEVEQRRPTVVLTDLGKAVMLGREAVPSALRLSFPLGKQLASVASRMEAADVGAPVEDMDAIVGGEPTSSPVGSDLPGGELGRQAATDGVVQQARAAEDVGSDASAELMGRLKSWRRRIAAASGLPAFRVLTNATLERIAQKRPRTASELESIAGVGSATVEEYGFDIIELVVHCEAELDVDGARTEIEKPSYANGAAANGTDDSEFSGNELTARDAAACESSVRESSYWTWRLADDGYSLADMKAIRRVEVQALLGDLLVELGKGKLLSASWLETNEGAEALFSGGEEGSVRLWDEVKRLVAEGGRG